VRTIDDIDQPLLWIVPFAALTLVTIISLVNIVLQFLPESSGYVLMVIACGFICASVSGFLTELIKGRCKYVYISMSIAVFIGAISFLVAYGFFKSNVIAGPQIAAVSSISEIVSNITLTLLPGLFVGAIVGGGVGFLPEETEYIEPEKKIEKTVVAPDKVVGYEKACRRCGAVMPFDSLFCSQCGGTLKKRRNEAMKYCRYCGNAIPRDSTFCSFCGDKLL